MCERDIRSGLFAFFFGLVNSSFFIRTSGCIVAYTNSTTVESQIQSASKARLKK